MICSNCMIPEGKFNVYLDEKGVCNYCNHYFKHKDINDYRTKERFFVNRLDKFKGKYEFDALVGLSGGKDSTYVLYNMVKKYKLNILAMTYDNGFLTDYAKESIKNTVLKLGIKHVFYKPDEKIHKKFYIESVKKLGDPCIACGLGGYFLSLKICYEKRIPFFIHGRSPFQMYRNFYPNSKDIFLSMMNLNLKTHSFKEISKAYSAIHKNVRTFITSIFDNEKDANNVLNEFFLNPSNFDETFSPEFLAYFLFNVYDEEKIKKELFKTIGWNRPDKDSLLGHADCKLHNIAAFMFNEINSVNILEPDIAVMLRFNAITKDEAKKLIIKNKLDKKNIDKSMKYLCDLCDFKCSEFKSYLENLKSNNIKKYESR